MNRNEPYRLKFLALAFAGGMVLSAQPAANVWAVQVDENHKTWSSVTEGGVSSKVLSELADVQQVFDNTPEKSELAVLSATEMQETRGAMSSYLLDPAGWRYWDVGLASLLRHPSGIGGCMMHSLCPMVGGWHIWKSDNDMRNQFSYIKR